MPASPAEFRLHPDPACVILPASRAKGRTSVAKPHPLKFYAMTLPDRPWDDFLARVKRHEELGFDITAIADHFVDHRRPDKPWLEAWTLAAAIARETSRIRIATCVCQIPLREPAMLAYQVLTVDHISGGRLDLGLGIGLTSDPACTMMGLPSWTNRERVDRLEEYVTIVARLLADDVTTFEGRFYRVEGAVTNAPVQRPRPPIMIAANGPRMLKLTARHADIWNAISFADSFDAQMAEIAERVQRIEEHCATIGRDPATLRRSYHMYDVAARSSGGRLSYYESEDAFVDTVERITALGFTEIGLYEPTVDSQQPMFERIATDVIPRLRTRHAA